jgi:N-hydroxyarylamine O-acetyltransferase
LWCGCPFFKPVRFESDVQNRSHFGNDIVYLLPVDTDKSLFKYVRYTNGNQSGKSWQFNSRQEVKVSDFSEVIENSNKPGASFMSILRCQLYQTDKMRSVSLVNNKFGIRYSNGETVVRTLTSTKEIKDVISDEFLLPKLPVVEAVNVLGKLNIDIFLENSK